MILSRTSMSLLAAATVAVAAVSIFDGPFMRALDSWAQHQGYATAQASNVLWRKPAGTLWWLPGTPAKRHATVQKADDDEPENDE